MKKVLVLILVVLLAGFAVVSAKEKKEVKPIKISQIPDGTYFGKTKGLLTGVKVEVTVKKGRITKIEILKARGMPRYKKKALKEMPGRIIKAQSLKVDAVTGATISSKNIIKAVRNALLKAITVQGPKS
ncbi:FMN-binding protein [bacterium]|nr:FMN-binding protein [bacterium]